ncbi:hypothetical protein L249_1231 [Ophiocordyceps polyrhachis-furcata BCC 54312]|uniref:Uncharacterized protein n=1 Tax=Ophiocordyceps polyrhachis-furcata BCC 54312 TaxID=1330021 RepID=A0A367LDY1_9HYPO|nr:hypothetical protein L249_1231 [Ophiocordyceps polyrhachis-furcata BCC 54312]
MCKSQTLIAQDSNIDVLRRWFSSLAENRASVETNPLAGVRAGQCALSWCPVPLLYRAACYTVRPRPTNQRSVISGHNSPLVTCPGIYCAVCRSGKREDLRGEKRPDRNL